MSASGVCLSACPDTVMNGDFTISGSGSKVHSPSHISKEISMEEMRIITINCAICMLFLLYVCLHAF